jgi:hypothetical protein
MNRRALSLASRDKSDTLSRALTEKGGGGIYELSILVSPPAEGYADDCLMPARV